MKAVADLTHNMRMHLLGVVGAVFDELKLASHHTHR